MRRVAGRRREVRAGGAAAAGAGAGAEGCAGGMEEAPGGRRARGVAPTRSVGSATASGAARRAPAPRAPAPARPVARPCRPDAAVTAGTVRAAGRGGRSLDGHTAGQGGDGHGDQERCGRRRSMHPRNSAASGPLRGADKRRLPRTGDPSASPEGAGVRKMNRRRVECLTRPWRRRSAPGSDPRDRCDARTPRSCGCRSSAG